MRPCGVGSGVGGGGGGFDRLYAALKFGRMAVYVDHQPAAALADGVGRGGDGRGGREREELPRLLGCGQVLDGRLRSQVIGVRCRSLAPPLLPPPPPLGSTDAVIAESSFRAMHGGFAGGGCGRPGGSCAGAPLAPVARSMPAQVYIDSNTALPYDLFNALVVAGRRARNRGQHELHEERLASGAWRRRLRRNVSLPTSASAAYIAAPAAVPVLSPSAPSLAAMLAPVSTSAAVATTRRRSLCPVTEAAAVPTAFRSLR